MAEVLTRQTVTATGPRNVRVTGILNRIRLILDLWSERRALDRLDTHMLQDIGLDALAAREESARAPWDVPRNRLASDDRYRLWQGF